MIGVNTQRLSMEGTYSNITFEPPKLDQNESILMKMLEKDEKKHQKL